VNYYYFNYGVICLLFNFLISIFVYKSHKIRYIYAETIKLFYHNRNLITNVTYYILAIYIKTRSIFSTFRKRVQKGSKYTLFYYKSRGYIEAQKKGTRQPTGALDFLIVCVSYATTASERSGCSGPCPWAAPCSAARDTRS
jgi:hypothetical protein